MPNYCSENEQVKRAYAFFLEAANGKQTTTTDGVLRSIARFEQSTGCKPFRSFSSEQARSFRLQLVEEFGPNGKPLSAATVTTTLKHLRDFFLWLSREPGFRSKLNPNDANYFTPSEQDRRIAGARREGPVPSLEEIKRVLSAMPAQTPLEKRNRAVVAFAILTGVRDGALASFRLKHVDLSAHTLFQDGREVNTKGRKTFTSCFFPVGPEPLEIVASYLAMLTCELGFGPDNPLFPSTRMAHGEDRSFVAIGLAREPWCTTAPIRQIFREAFREAGLPYSNPHVFRKTLVRIGQSICRSPEEWKAWSQNLGHESEATTFVGYGQVPAHRQAEILRKLAVGRASVLPADLNLEALETFLESAKRVSASA